MKLSKSAKEDIIHKVLKKSSHQKILDKLKKQRHELSKKAYNMLIQSEKLECLATLPEWAKSCYSTIQIAGFPKGGVVRLDMGDYYPWPQGCSYTYRERLSRTESDKDAVEVLERLCRDVEVVTGHIEACQTEMRDEVEKLRSILSSINTTKQLVENLPALVPFIDKESTAKKTANLPAVQYKTANARIQAMIAETESDSQL